MSNEPTQVNVPSLSINLVEPTQVIAWCTAFECSEPELRECVRLVGAGVGDVQRELARRRRRRAIDRITVLPRGVLARSTSGASDDR